MRLARFLMSLSLLGISGQASAAECDAACLQLRVQQTLEAIVTKSPQNLPWADQVTFTENGVPLMVGDGLWGSTGETPPKTLLTVVDAESSSAVWVGIVTDHGQPAFGALRLRTIGDRIAELEFLVARQGNPGPYGDPKAYTISSGGLPPRSSAGGLSRQRLVDIGNSYLTSRQRNDGVVLGDFTPGCRMYQNGVPVLRAVRSRSRGSSSSCKELLKRSAFCESHAIRDRRYPVVDALRGFAVAFFQEDIPALAEGRQVRDVSEVPPFPQTRNTIEILHFAGEQIQRVDSITVYQPYGMRSPWVCNPQPARANTTRCNGMDQNDD